MRSSEELNLLLAINVRWWNAEAAYAINLARAFRDQGTKVWLIVNKNSPVHHKALEHNLSVITNIKLDTYSLPTIISNYYKLRNFVDREGINVINSFKSNGSFLFSLIKKSRSDIKYIRTRGEARVPKNNIFNRKLYSKNGCDGIITVGNIVRRWLQPLELEDQYIKTIYFGDSPTVSSENTNQAEIKEKLGINPESRVLALVGRTQKVKGHLQILEALTKVRSLPIHQLFLVKDLEEFPEELEEIKQFIRRHDLDNQVTILGFRKDLADILSIVDMGVIPSLSSEVNCRVTVEFFSMKIPVLSYTTGTLPEIIDHKKNGYISENSPTDLAKGLHWMLDQERDLKEMGKKAYQSYLNDFTLEKFYRETKEFYQNC